MVFYSITGVLRGFDAGRATWRLRCLRPANVVYPSFDGAQCPILRWGFGACHCVQVPCNARRSHGTMRYQTRSVAASHSFYADVLHRLGLLCTLVNEERRRRFPGQGLPGSAPVHTLDGSWRVPRSRCGSRRWSRCLLQLGFALSDDTLSWLVEPRHVRTLSTFFVGSAATVARPLCRLKPRHCDCVLHHLDCWR